MDKSGIGISTDLCPTLRPCASGDARPCWACRRLEGSPGVSARENEDLHALLNREKCRIGCVSEWKVLKRTTNDYELLGSVVGSAPPVSRAYFKMWEILASGHISPSLIRQAKPLRVVALAEGPGGFVESLTRYRARYRPSWDPDPDILHGMTLVSSSGGAGSGMPRWRIDRVLSNQKKLRCSVVLHKGSDGTGNLYNVGNIDALVEAVCGSSASASTGCAGCADLVTADGGFDIGGSYELQEELSIRLIVCEVYAALRLQAIGGSFVLKVFDICHPATVAIIGVIRRSYKTVRLVKPLSSRPANSEKYVVASGFEGTDPGVLEKLRACVLEEVDSALRDAVLDVQGPHPCERLFADILEFNRRQIGRQLKVLQDTIELGQPRQQKADATAAKQYRLAVDWLRAMHHSGPLCDARLPPMPSHWNCYRATGSGGV